MPRYAGQTFRPYSVAQHCLLVAELLPKMRLYALIHDAQEALLCDIPTPAKEAMRALGSTAYDELEWRLYKAVCRKVGLEERAPIVIKIADVESRILESAALRRKSPRIPKVLKPILSLPDGGRVAWLDAVREEMKP